MEKRQKQTNIGLTQNSLKPTYGCPKCLASSTQSVFVYEIRLLYAYEQEEQPICRLLPTGRPLLRSGKWTLHWFSNVRTS